MLLFILTRIVAIHDNEKFGARVHGLLHKFNLLNDWCAYSGYNMDCSCRNLSSGLLQHPGSQVSHLHTCNKIHLNLCMQQIAHEYFNYVLHLILCNCTYNSQRRFGDI